MVFNPEGNGALSESLVNYRVLRVGDIAFEGHKNKDFLFGRFVLNDVGNGIMSPRFSSLRPIEYLNISFWKQYIHYEPIMRGILKNSTKLGTMMNELVIDDFLKQPIDVPTLKEQTAIGDFFRQLDAAIASHQRKLERVKELKKSLLQKMFPKDGEAFPELRFPNFTDAWEQRKLGELADIVRGASPRPIQDVKWFDNDSDVGWLRISDVTEQDGRIKYLAQRISKLGQEKTRVLVEPHLLLSIAATVGKPVVNYVKTGVHDGFLIFLNPKFEQEFMFQWLDAFRENWKKYGQPGSQVNLNSDLVRNQDIYIPSPQEQTAIGNFFRQLDAAIASHQRKPVLQKASKIKQADTISACFWLAKSSQMPHHNIGILIFKFLNNMNISVLRGGHARMPEPSRHAGNRYPGKKQ